MMETSCPFFVPRKPGMKLAKELSEVFDIRIRL